MLITKQKFGLVVESKLTRRADPKVKDNLHIHARNTSEQQLISDLKRLAMQDEVDLSDLVFEGILLMFTAHHWPPGNPQIQLCVFQNEQKPTVNQTCKCGRPAKIWTTYIPENRQLYLCEKCYTKLPLRHDPKLYHTTKQITPEH